MIEEEKTPEFPKEMVEKAARRAIRIPPSQRRVLDMDDDTLLQHNAIIAHKASSLSSSQRKMVQNRVMYGIKSKRFTMETVVGEVNKLTEYLQSQIIEKDDSSPSEQ